MIALKLDIIENIIIIKNNLGYIYHKIYEFRKAEIVLNEAFAMTTTESSNNM